MIPEEKEAYIQKLKEERLAKRREYYRTYAKKYRTDSHRYQEYIRTYRVTNREKQAQWQRQYRTKNLYHRKYILRRNYNITLEYYDAMLAAQGGQCAVPTCRADKPGGKRIYFYVDHDHDTGAVRGLICLRCNIMLHKGRDTKEFLLGLIEYLENAR